MEDSRLVKEVVFREMEGKTKRGRPKREWLDDAKEWCNKEIYILKRKALDTDAWKMIVKCALDMNGDEPMECRMESLDNYTILDVCYHIQMS